MQIEQLTTLIDVCLYNFSIFYLLKAYDAYLKKNYIMDENNPLSEGNKISLGNNRTNDAFTSKSS